MAFRFVLEHLCQIFLRYVNRLVDANRDKLFIFHDKNEMIESIGSKIINTGHYFGDKTMHVALYLGVDATFIVQICQVIRSYSKIVGGASPKHC